MSERWLPITLPEYSHLYEVSDAGRVRRVGKEKCLTGWPSITGHLRVTLSRPGPPRKLFPYMVHRLVLEAFVGPCPLKMECCHNDSNPANNALENLRWDTRSGNQMDRHKTDAWQKNRGEGNGRAKLKVSDVRAIRADERPNWRIAAELGVSESTVARARRGNGWRYA